MGKKVQPSTGCKIKLSEFTKGTAQYLQEQGAGTSELGEVGNMVETGKRPIVQEVIHHLIAHTSSETAQMQTG